MLDKIPPVCSSWGHRERLCRRRIFRTKVSDRDQSPQLGIECCLWPWRCVVKNTDKWQEFLLVVLKSQFYYWGMILLSARKHSQNWFDPKTKLNCGLQWRHPRAVLRSGQGWRRRVPWQKLSLIRTETGNQELLRHTAHHITVTLPRYYLPGKYLRLALREYYSMETLYTFTFHIYAVYGRKGCL